MDQKAWLWRRRSSEKTIETNDEDVQSVQIEKEVELENSIKALNEKMTSIRDECSAKVQNYEEIAENAIADKNKAEHETLRLRQELNEAHERLLHLNTALKETMEQLKLVREEQEQKIHNAVIEASREFEKSHKKLEQKLSENSKSLSSLTVESSYLSKALLVKEKIIEDLNNSKFQMESEFEALMSRLDSIEKENAFLRYEYRTLEKEFDLKNEEMEGANKVHLENVKKIRRLEGECQRLRTMTRKRLPSVGPDKANKKVSLLIDQVCGLEKENRILKECLAKKEEEMEIVFREKVEKLDLAVTDYVSDECKMIGASDMSLMDDFVEMEKLAIVAVDENMTILDKHRDWIEDVRDLISKERNVSKRSIDELLGDVRARLDDVVRPGPDKLVPISGYIGWKSPTLSPRSFLEKSIEKILELVDRFDLRCEQISNFKICVFKWENAETNTALQEFVHSCNCLKEGKIDFEKFIEDLASILDWIMDKCVSNQDRCAVRDEFEKHLGGAGPGTALELESVQKLMFELEKIDSISQVEIEGLKNKVEMLKRTSEDEIDNMKVINEDLDTELSVTKSKLNEVLHKLSSVQVELDDKTHCCEELEGACLDLRLQLESITSKPYSEDKENQEELLRTGSEITKASLKLSECEETILKLGNHLKALGSAKELSIVDKVMSLTDTNSKKFKQHLSLHDQMMSEDNVEVKNHTKEDICATEANALTLWDREIVTPKAYMKNEKGGALFIIPGKRRSGGFGFLKKLLIRRKKTSSKNTLLW